MTPGGGKRKRGDRTYSHDSADGFGRPSPHRPGNLGLAHHGSQGYQNARSRPRNTGTRGGRGGPYAPGSPVSGAFIQPSKGSQTLASVMIPPKIAPTPPTPGPSLSPNTQAHEEPPLPYAYDFLTDEIISDWKATGRLGVINKAVQAATEKDYLTLSSVFQELIHAGMYGRIDATEAGKAVRDIVAGTPTDNLVDASSTFLDTLSVVTEHKTANIQLPSIVMATEIPAALMREILEEPLLKALGLIRDTFAKMFIRKQTNVLYRQANYNLLREETEGYSKLVTELFTTTANGPPSTNLVEDTFENIKALIGAFDLDAGRVLDVTLDVFASILVKNFRFFVKLLRCSSWWPQDVDDVSEHLLLGGLPIWAQPNHMSWVASDEDKTRILSLREARDIAFWERARKDGVAAFFTLGNREILTVDRDSNASGSVKESDAVTAQETDMWIKVTGTKPPPGNSVAAQLLGFKLRFYSSNARDAQDKLPPNLIYLSSLLIKIGFISLRDLYSHLYPPDDSMESVRGKQMKEKADRERLKRPGGGTNALASAGALIDDTLPPQPAAPVSRLRDTETRSGTPARGEPPSSTVGTPAEKAEDQTEKDQLPDPSDQKVELLRSLLCIGALPEALYLLGRFPWLPDAFPDLPEHIHRILHHCLSKVYQPLCPLNERDSLRFTALTPAQDQTGLPKGDVRLTDMPPPKILRWAKADINNSTDGCDYRFYWDDWNDNVPVCQTVDDVFTMCSTLLNYTGVKIGQDAKLLIKIVRIGRHSLNEDSSASNTQRWIDLSRRLLVPALSLTRANPDAVTEVFDLLKRFPTQVRFSLYAEWYEGQTSRLSDIQDAFTLARIETKDTLRRISKTNTKQMARALAKVACASPGVVFATALSQIEAYDNFIEVIVECGRYFTYMGYDVLTWSIMNALGRAGRDRISGDGISTSGWLIALAKFVGKVYRRYAHMNPLPILQYVLEQVRQNNFTDLRILRELISNMAGIAADTNFSDAQVQAMAGGELLQSQTLLQLQDTRHDNKSSAKRLMKCITDNGLTDQLLVSIAQERQMCIFNPAQDSLKVISENFDDINVVLTQYLEMLRTNLSTKDFLESLPNIASLVIDYGLDPSIAFTIHRIGISRAIAAYDAALKEEEAEKPRKLSNGSPEMNGDVQMTDLPTSSIPSQALSDEPSDAPLTNVSTKSPSGEIDTSDIPLSGTLLEYNDIVGNKVSRPWHPVLQNLMEELQVALGDEFEQSMSLPFFVTFWQLSLQDLSAPSSSYNDEIEKQKKALALISADRSDISAIGMAKKENEKKRVNDLLDRLKEEMKSHIYSYSHVRGRLMKEKDHWFTRFIGKPHALNASLLQECFLPRLLLSPLDSFFTFKMLFFLHGAGTPGFSTMHFLDRLLDEKSLIAIIFQCTARESENLGRFLFEVLKELSLWHAKQSEYEKKAFGKDKLLPGFARSVQDGKPTNLLGFEDFRRILRKWHINLNNVLKTCLSGDEYMHIKNAITILKCIQKVFPAINFVGNQLCDVIHNLIKSEKDSRQDIWVAANSLYGSLKSREKQWVLPQAFYTSDAPPGQNGIVRSASIRKKPIPFNKSSDQKLNASASEFHPKSSSSGNDVLDLPKFGKSEVEDGELNDSEMTDATSNPEMSKAAENEANVGSNDEASASESKSEPRAAADAVQKSESQLSQQRPVATSSSRDDVLQGTRRTIPNAPITKPESNRSGATTPSNRVQHDLPNRPEPQRSLRPRYSERLDSNSRPPEHGRLERPVDLMHQRQRDQLNQAPARFDGSSADRRRDGGLHDIRDFRDAPIDGRQLRGDSRVARYSTRDTESGRRPLDGPPRRDGRDNSFAAPTESSTRHSQAASTASPKPTRSESSMLNPERAALIGQTPETSRDERTRLPSSQNNRDVMSSARQTPADGSRITRSSGAIESAPRSSRSSRPSSLDRGERPQQGSRDEDHRDDRISEDYRRSGRDRGDSRMETTPLGPRSSRPSRNPNSDLSRHSDLMQPPPAVHGASDYGHGRSVSDYPRPQRHQESTYGRLNQESGSPPSPQRPSSGFGRSNAPREAQSQSRPPSGPGGGSYATSDQSRDRGPVPTGPAAPSPTSGKANAATESSAKEITGIHPDRLNNIDAPVAAKPSPLQIPPSGPRSTQPNSINTPTSTNAAPSPTARNPPTGPSGNSSDRRRQFQSIQTHLSQGSGATSSQSANTSGTNIRIQGRAAQGRSSNDSPVIVPSISNRFSLQSNEISGLPTQQRYEHTPQESDFGRREGPPTRDTRASERERDRDREGERSYRSSRNATPERNAQPRSGNNPSDKMLRPAPGERSDYVDNNYTRGGGERERDRDRDRDHRELEYPPHESRYAHGLNRGPPPLDPVNGQGSRWGNDRVPPRRVQGGAPRVDDRRDMGSRKRSWIGEMESSGSAQQGESKRPRRPA